MSRTNSIDNFARELVGAFDVHNCRYDDLSELARRLVAFAEERSLPDCERGIADRPIDRLAQRFSKRHFASFRTQLRCHSTLELAFVELFLLSRIRTYVLAYLSVQEGEDFEGRASYETSIPVFISQLIGYLGKRSNCTLNLGHKWMNLRLEFDPLVHLRKIYGLVLLGERQRRKLSFVQKGQIAFHRLAFSLKSSLVAFVIGVGIRRVGKRGYASGIRSLLRTASVRRSLATGILVLFPSARELTESEWLELLSRIEGFFASRVRDLLDAMPEHSISNHGLIKLCKVGFGTIAGRTSVRQLHEKDNVEFIFNTLRLAYSWGATYPLVDNVLDSALTSLEDRSRLTSVLNDLFFGNCVRKDEHVNENRCDSASVREISVRLTEVLSLVPPHRLQQAQRILGHLLESHRRDSKRRLSDLEACEDQCNIRTEVMADTALKAALVRLATMEICGISVDDETFARSLVRSLFNQLGDDLWDIYEDFEDDRVTPYTLFLTQPGTSNPFGFYFEYAALIAEGLSKRRQTAVFMGFCETLRDSLLALKDRDDDRLGVSGAIARTLGRLCKVSAIELIKDVPHVDFDAVLFAFETALLEIAGRH